MLKSHANASCYCSRDRNVKKPLSPVWQSITDRNSNEISLAGDHIMCDVKRLCKKICVLDYDLSLSSGLMRNDEFFCSFDGVWRCLSAVPCKQKLQSIFFLEFSSSLANLAICRNNRRKSKPSQFHSIHHRRWTFYFPSKRAECMKSNRLIVFFAKIF